YASRESPAPIRPYPPHISHRWLERPPMRYRMRRLESACPRRQIPGQIPVDTSREADALHRYRSGQQNAHTAARLEQIVMVILPTSPPDWGEQMASGVLENRSRRG